MILNLIGPFTVNAPFGTEIAFAKGLKRMGHGVNTVDPNIESQFDAMDRTADATVVFKSCVGHEDLLLNGLRGPVIVYQPDDARFVHIKKMMLDMRRHASLLLSFDGYGADVALTMGYQAAETLLLTADDELYCPSPQPIERDIDVSFIGSLGDPVAHASRRRMCEIVQREAGSRGWITHFGTTQDMPTLLDVYRRSKVVLNHATDVGQPFGYGYGLQCRHFEVSMTRTAMLTNIVYDDPMALPFLTFNSERTLLEGVELGIRDHEKFGRWAYDAVMDKHRPNNRAVQLVDFIERNA